MFNAVYYKMSAHFLIGIVWSEQKHLIFEVMGNGVNFLDK